MEEAVWEKDRGSQEIRMRQGGGRQRGSTEEMRQGGRRED